MSDRSSARRNLNYGEAQELGAQMRLYRKAAKISLREMSEKTGRPKSTLADAETGWVKPSQDLLKTYEETLALPKGTLVTEAAPIASSVDSPFALPGPGNTDLMAHAAIPPQPTIIDDEIECRELIISLLLHASDQPREIVLMMANPPAHLGELQMRWFGALATALEQRDHITHIWTPPPNLHYSHTLVQNMLYLTTLAQKSGGQYTILFLPNVFLLWTLPYELFVMPNEAAVELFGKWQGGYTDSAIFYPATERPEFVRHFRSYISMLKSMAEPLVRTYPLHGSPELAKVILDAEQLDGEELLMVAPISDKTIPGRVRRARMQRILKNLNDDPGLNDWLRDDYAFCEQRRRRFEERVRRWPVRHLLYRQALEGMARDNQFRDSKTDRFGAIAELKPEEIRICIRQLIDDLQHFPNYEVALTTEPLQEGPQSYCEVVGDICLFVIAEAGKALLNVTIKQKRVLQLQKNYFAHQWALLPKAVKDRVEVIKFLSTLISAE